MINYYAYLRVSTTKQDVGRQLEAIAEWEIKNNVNIPKENYFTDYYTGKTFDRENYQKLKQKIKQNDYLIVKEIDRLGRDWDGIKNEFQYLKDNKINIIVIDISLLSDPLPWENTAIEGLDLRYLKESVLNLMCYAAQKEREKHSQRTKESLAEKKKNGTKSGRPIGRAYKSTTTFENFMKTLNYIIENGTGQERSCYRCGFSATTFKKKLKEYRAKFGVYDYKDLLNALNKATKNGKDVGTLWQ